MALRHQQSSLSWWGAGWGHWGGIPKAAPPPPALHCLATGTHSFSKGRMRSWPRGAGWGHRGGIPRVGYPLPPLPSRGGCSPSNSRTSPWLRDAGCGHGGGIPRAGSSAPHCPAMGDAALPRAELTAPAEVHAISPAHLAVRVVLAAGPQAAIPGATRGLRRPQPWHWGDWHAAVGLASLGLRQCKSPLKANGAQAVAVLSGMAGDRTQHLCCLLPASFPRPRNSCSLKALGAILPILSPSSGPCMLPQRCCSPSQGASPKPQVGAGGAPRPLVPGGTRCIPGLLCSPPS